MIQHMHTARTIRPLNPSNMFALASQATIAPIAAPLRARKAPKTALRRAAVRVNASPDAKSDDDRAMFSRRQLGLGSAALASLMATDMTVVNPAMAKKIISGKQDVPDIADVSKRPTRPPFYTQKYLTGYACWIR